MKYVYRIKRLRARGRMSIYYKCIGNILCTRASIDALMTAMPVDNSTLSVNINNSIKTLRNLQ